MESRHHRSASSPVDTLHKNTVDTVETPNARGHVRAKTFSEADSKKKRKDNNTRKKKKKARPGKRRLALVWLRRNWIFFFMILVALSAGAYCLYIMLGGCESQDTGADIVFSLDESTTVSMTEWKLIGKACQAYMGPFIEADFSGELKFGVVEWNGGGPSEISIPLTSDHHYVRDRLGKLTKNTRVYTAFGTALAGCALQYDDHGGDGEEDKFRANKLCMIVTDGERWREYNNRKNEKTGEYTKEVNWGVYDYCQKHMEPGVKCTVENVAAQMKAEGWLISVTRICIGTGLCRIQYQKPIMSCDEYTLENFQELCPFYSDASSFQDLVDRSDVLATTLSEQVKGRGELCTPPLIPLIVFMAFLPFLLYFLLRPLQFLWERRQRRLRRQARKEKEAMLPRKEDMSDVTTVATETTVSETPVTVDENAPVDETKKKYEWDVQYADTYMWAGSSGGVMKVDYGTKYAPPPSAPQIKAPKKLKEVTTDEEFVEVVEKEEFDSTAELVTAVYAGHQWQADTSKTLFPCCWGEEDEVGDVIDDADGALGGGGGDGDDDVTPRAPRSSFTEGAGPAPEEKKKKKKKKKKTAKGEGGGGGKGGGSETEQAGGNASGLLHRKSSFVVGVV